jgi:hypothetical protein
MIAVFAMSFALWAQTPPESLGLLRTPEQLEELLGPIALYPDALVAPMLPAATVPGDILLASHYVRNGGDPQAIDSQPWDESVRSLAHYPSVLLWMEANIHWTERVGEAFVLQPDGVMLSIQVLRAKARAAGNLENTREQTVGVDNGAIVIKPTQPGLIFVPVYEPALVYLPKPPGFKEPLISFGFGYATGPWLRHECDWQLPGIWIGRR